jgi:hypothetical protein
MRLLLLLVLAFSVACASTTPPAHERAAAWVEDRALQASDAVAEEVVAFQAAPMSTMRYAASAAVTAPSVPAFQFQCTSTAQRITPPSGDAGYRQITVWNAACSAGTCTESATPVFLGGVRDAKGAQTAAVTNATGMPICNTTGCIGKFATYAVPNLECIASGNTTVTVQVLK